MKKQSNFRVSIKGNKAIKTIIILESNKLSILRDTVSCVVILICLFCCYLNFKFCGNSTLLQLFFISISFAGAFIFGRKDTPINNKENLMKFLNDNID